MVALVRIGLKKDRAFFMIALAVFILDQITKALVRANIAMGQSIPEDAPIRLTHLTNSGGVFGILTNYAFLFLIVGIIGAVVIFLLYRAFAPESLILRIGLAMELGGALGNLADRIRWGVVTDFIDLRFWPTFNLADSSIVVGTALIVWFLLTQKGGLKSQGDGKE